MLTKTEKLINRLILKERCLRYSLFGILVAQNISDWYLTGLIVARDGFGAEANPIMHHMLEWSGSMDGILYFKLLALSWAFVCMYLADYDRNRLMRTLLLSANMLYSFDLLHSLMVLFPG